MFAKQDLAGQPRSRIAMRGGIEELVLAGLRTIDARMCRIDVDMARGARESSAAQRLQFVEAGVPHDLHDG